MGLGNPKVILSLAITLAVWGLVFPTAYVRMTLSGSETRTGLVTHLRFTPTPIAA